MKILIVDDESVNRTVLSRILGDAAQKDFAESAAEAIEAFQAARASGEPYDLILLDIMMPGMDGHECLATIRRLEKEGGVRPGSEIKAVIISALSDQKNVCTAFFQGQAECYLPKPVVAKDLLRIVESLRQAG